MAYVAHLAPSGYYLVPTDDELPPWKLRSDEGEFDELPPAFIHVLKLELAEEQQYLGILRKLNEAPDPRFHKQWQSLLLTGGAGGGDTEPPTGSPGVFLLATTWNQNAPYNEFCPTATGGPGGRAWAGCTACALAQILRYHRQPVAISGNYSYTDDGGNCQGTHCAADVGLANYDWGNMPNSVTSTSPQAQRDAIARLVYHCAVVLDSDFEAGGTSAYPDKVPGRLQTCFNYTSGALEPKKNYTSAAWCARIAGSIDQNLPVFYSLYEVAANGSLTNGHAAVCDGYQNGSEIHLNLGWSGSWNAWYNLDTITASGYTWTVHKAVFGITPPVAPSISTQPQSQAVNVGSSVTFSVVASGSQPLFYQWRFNGVNIPGGTSASYTISNVQTSQAGNYTVIVSNAAGTATSTTAALAVNVPPFVTAQPQSQTVTAGNSVTFSVTASGTTPLSYQWYQKDSPVAGATNPSYKISATQLSDAGGYKVRVNNVAGNVDSAVAILTVQSAPVITGQPQGQTVIVGDTVTFTVATGGVPAPNYQWRFNGNPIPSASETSYTIPSVTTNNTGSYSVTISNPLGQANSATATLTVLVPFPGIYNTGLSDNRMLLADGQVDPHYRLVVNPNNPASSASVVQDSTAWPIAGGPWVQNSSISKWIGPTLNTSGAAAGNYSYQLTVDLTGYDPSTAFLAGSWAADDTGSIFLNGADTGFRSTNYFVSFSTFTLANGFVSGTNLIEFRVSNAASPTGLRVENLLGTAQKATVPFVVAQPNGATKVIGDNLTFTVVAGGASPLRYQWRFNGADIPTDTRASLALTNLQLSQGGNYDAIVSNNFGWVTSAVATLTVWIPPAITQQPVSLAVTQGSSASFSASASGDTPLSYQWRAGSQILSGATNNSYMIASAQAINAGSYDVIVWNHAGSVTSTAATLTVWILPAITQQPVSLAVTQGSSASFSASASGDTPLSYQWKCNGVNISGATNACYTIPNVQRSQAGNYTVTISNPVGQTNSADATLAVLVPFPGIYNTGLSDDRTLLGDDQVDPHYKLEVNPNNPASSASVVQDSTLYPIAGGPWVQNSSISKWIGPALNTVGAAAGNYSYQLTVDLTGYDPSTAFLAGSWAADDTGSIFLNGVDTGFRSTNYFVSFSTFTLTNGFVSGTNLIEFRVGNGASWTGLRVENLQSTVLTAVTATQPTLTVSRVGNDIRVAWPVSATGFVLQETSSPPGNWADSLASVVVQGNENVAVIATSGTLKFYRLHK